MKLALAIVLIANMTLAFLAVSITFRAYQEEKEHAAYLYDCTHMQRPEVCENEWLKQQEKE